MDIYQLCLEVAVVEERLLALRKLLSDGNSLKGREAKHEREVWSNLGEVNDALLALKRSVVQLEYAWVSQLTQRMTTMRRDR